jgi:hypothetical protein
MVAFLVSPDITTFIGARATGEFFEGQVDVLQGPRASRVQHICLRVRDTEAEALRDAHGDAKTLIEMWRQRQPLP